MPRTIFITGTVKADCLRIRNTLRRRFRQSSIQVNAGSNLIEDGVLLVQATDSGAEASRRAEGMVEEKTGLRAEFLLEATRILSSPKALERPKAFEQALADVTSKSREILGDTAFVFLLRDDQNNTPDLVCAVSGESDKLPLMLTSLLNAQSSLRSELKAMIQRGEESFLPDLSESSEPREFIRVIREFGFKSMMAVPIKQDGELYGEFFTLSPTPREFDESHLAIAAELAQAMAVSVRHARFIAQLEERANTDVMTGLYNHRFFVEVLAREAARAERPEKPPLAMVMLDMDDLKRLNESQGHVAGHEALKHLSSCILESVRKEDFVFRYGGDEFAVIVPGADWERCLAAGAHILESVRTKTPPGSATFVGPITVSIGVAEYERGQGSDKGAENLVKNADAALSAAKKSGKNQMKAYRPDLAAGDGA
jgi:diguanylate cyclase (GGDEF)-like protein